MTHPGALITIELMQPDTPRVPLTVQCAKCEHTWIAAHMPMPLDEAMDLDKTKCPNCGADAHYIRARKNAGVA